MTTQTEALKRIASELRYYNPLADKYKGEFIHKGWATRIEEALSSPNGEAQPEQDEVDIRSRLYQRIYELETQLVQPEQCTGCEGKPSNANNPCAVCGKSQPEQEPVAFVKGCNRGQWEIFPAKAHQIFGIDQPLYTTPPQRKPLTDEEIGAILEGVNAYGTRLYTFARAIEAKLKELNK